MRCLRHRQKVFVLPCPLPEETILDVEAQVVQEAIESSTKRLALPSVCRLRVLLHEGKVVEHAADVFAGVVAAGVAQGDGGEVDRQDRLWAGHQGFYGTSDNLDRPLRMS